MAYVPTWLAMALAAVVGIMCAFAQSPPSGPCLGGAFPDAGNCCPTMINMINFYRDARGCYPTRVANNQVLYADVGGCFPNAQGTYRPAGATCPPGQQCSPTCLPTVVATPQPTRPACPANAQRDPAGCCPRAFGMSLFYRDVRGCYPIATNVGVLYADASGCYPNEAGVYNPAGMACPAGRQCVPACD
ncbi:uncharacterized protein ACA1_394030 [Acanthamoeba castellanii str. Neff]|uniref:Uncharacterized protein n=1 Tax=Acanthamoeba castellanii (strain ATCC 30010 / Neff) TaxID=1257118 RepID=L8H0E3_ACACF|nr:uncharacterized protein ACA1_394030 [Acanthamoeba castellanii str. Neff]ELR18677.1 hypothetical protein ACA1_394030 [Acanthamoeba castellanii str. Neff]